MAIICKCMRTLCDVWNLPVRCGIIDVWNSSPCAAGMNMSPVSRLKKTWGKAKTAKFFILEVNGGQVLGWFGSAVRVIRAWCWCPWHWQHQMDPTGNFYNYRTALRGAAHRSRTANSNREKVALRASSLLGSSIVFISTHFRALGFSPDRDSILQSADQRHLLPKWRMC